MEKIYIYTHKVGQGKDEEQANEVGGHVTLMKGVVGWSDFWPHWHHLCLSVSLFLPKAMEVLRTIENISSRTNSLGKGI